MLPNSGSEVIALAERSCDLSSRARAWRRDAIRGLQLSPDYKVPILLGAKLRPCKQLGSCNLQPLPGTPSSAPCDCLPLLL